MKSILKYKLLVILLLVFCATTATEIKAKGFETPEAVVRAFILHAYNQEFDVLNACATNEFQPTLATIIYNNAKTKPGFVENSLPAWVLQNKSSIAPNSLVNATITELIQRKINPTNLVIKTFINGNKARCTYQGATKEQYLLVDNILGGTGGSGGGGGLGGVLGGWKVQLSADKSLYP